MSERLIDRLNKNQIEAILDALPIEFIFVDEEDRLQYFNKGEKRTRKGPDDILGKDIRQCHKAESLPRTDEMLSDFKSGDKDENEFWVEGRGTRLLNRFLAVRDKSGKYLGCLEYLLDFNALEQLAKDKADSYRFVVDSSKSDELVDEH